MNKLSIIIPTYNDFDGLKTTLDSVMKQTYQNFEIIVVNDGSNQCHLGRIKQYIQENSRISLYSKTNEGPGIARKYGYQYSTGDIISFIDSGDFIHPKMYEKMISFLMLNDCDVVHCGMYRTDINGYILNEKKIVNEDTVVKGNYEINKIFAERYHVTPYLADKLYKKDILRDIEFPPIYYAEDMWINTQVFNSIKKVGLMFESYYYYVMDANSLVRSSFNKSQLSGIDVGLKMYDYHIEKNTGFENFASRIVCYYIIRFYIHIKRDPNLNKNYSRKFRNIFKTHYKNLKTSGVYKRLPIKLKFMFGLSRVNLYFGSLLYQIYFKKYIKN